MERIETPDAICAFLEPLGLYEATTGPPTQAPPTQAGAELIDAFSGESFPAGPCGPSSVQLPRGKTDPLYHRRWMLPEAPDESCQPDAGENFDQTGIELPPWCEPRADPRQALLFADDHIQADPPDGEPVFLLTDTPDNPADNFIQPDAPDDAG